MSAAPAYDPLAHWSADAIERAQRVRLVAFDVDGSLTDGRIRIGAEGELAKAFHVHDGLGLRLLLDAGIAVAWITARQSEIVAARARELGIAEVIQGCRTKQSALAALCAQRGLSLADAAFFGDDLPDLPAMLACALAGCPGDAHPAVVARAHWQARRAGGAGAAREFCDGLLAAQGHWDAALARYLG